MTAAVAEPVFGEPDARLRIGQAAADMRENHGTGDPLQLFYAEVAHWLGSTPDRDAAGKIARAYCRGARIPAQGSR